MEVRKASLGCLPSTRNFPPVFPLTRRMTSLPAGCFPAVQPLGARASHLSSDPFPVGSIGQVPRRPAGRLFPVVHIWPAQVVLPPGTLGVLATLSAASSLLANPSVARQPASPFRRLRRSQGWFIRSLLSIHTEAREGWFNFLSSLVGIFVFIL